MIQVKDGSFSYGKKLVFEHLDFEAKSGETLAILGPNGAGKTTLLRVLIRTLKLTQGHTYIHGKDLLSLSEKELFKQVAYVPQMKRQTTGYTVLEMVLLGLTGELKLFHAPNEADVARAQNLLRELKIEDLADMRCDELSGGQLQMVIIARALIKNPDILILDEPESGLDFKNQLIILNTLNRLKEAGKCVIFNTHYPEHALRVADKVLLIHDHQSIFGPTDEVLSEENIQKAFQVATYRGSFLYDGKEEKTIVPMKLL